MSTERFDTLDLRRMAHAPLRDGTPLCSNDFLVNGQSLLHLLGHGERAGCFISTSERRNLAARKRLLLQAEPDTERGGVLIYACTCCGDLGCGGLTVRVHRDATAYTGPTSRWNRACSPPGCCRMSAPSAFSAATT